MISELSLEARDVMTTGVVTISDAATLEEAVDAMAEHRIHAVLVIGARTGAPLGWVNTRGLLGFSASTSGRRRRRPSPTAEVDRADGHAALGDLRARASGRDAAVGTAFRANQEPEGVISDYDLTVRATRLADSIDARGARERQHQRRPRGGTGRGAGRPPRANACGTSSTTTSASIAPAAKANENGSSPSICSTSR